MRKLISIGLAMLVLMTSVGFTVNTHYCGGRAMERSVTLTEESLHCGMNSWFDDCNSETQNEPHFKRKSCCVNEHEQFQLDEQAELQKPNWSINQAFIATSFSFLNSKAQTTSRVCKTFVFNNSPPTAKHSRRILFQSFLI